MAEPIGIKVPEIFGATFRARGGSTGADDCCVCGRALDPAKALFVTWSPASGLCYPAADIASLAKTNPELEASGYPIGPDCARRIRRQNPDFQNCLV